VGGTYKGLGLHYMSDSENIREIIFDTLRGSLKRPVELSEQTHIVDDLGLDSVAVMDFVMEIEDRLDLSVPLDKIAEIETLGDLLRVLSDLKAPV
jgi:acyl carrier protein